VRLHTPKNDGVPIVGQHIKIIVEFVREPRVRQKVGKRKRHLVVPFVIGAQLRGLGHAWREEEVRHLRGKKIAHGAVLYYGVGVVLVRRSSVCTHCSACVKKELLYKNN